MYIVLTKEHENDSLYDEDTDYEDEYDNGLVKVVPIKSKSKNKKERTDDYNKFINKKNKKKYKK